MDSGQLSEIDVKVQAKLIAGDDKDIVGSFEVDAEGAAVIQRQIRSRGEVEYSGPTWCEGVRYEVVVPVMISRMMKDKESETPRYTGLPRLLPV